MAQITYQEKGIPHTFRSEYWRESGRVSTNSTLSEYVRQDDNGQTYSSGSSGKSYTKYQINQLITALNDSMDASLSALDASMSALDASIRDIDFTPYALKEYTYTKAEIDASIAALTKKQDVVCLSQDEYSALDVKDSSTIYMLY